MLFSCERPYAFYGLLLLVPSIFFTINKFRTVITQSKKIVVSDADFYEDKRIKIIPRILILRTVLRAFSWVLLVFAYAGVSWGTYELPVQKSGSAVSFVFDISYSMTADDAPGGLTRLQAASRYADMLLSRMGDASVSVVLAKGDGVIVVPLTEDTAVVQSLLDTLSPSLMSASGSSLKKGIDAALQSFPASSAQTAHIWVFSDGDETDGQLVSALESCIKRGVSVSLIGFGTEREVEVLAGDGKTKVFTALRSEKLKKAAVQSSKHALNFNSNASVQYIDATESGSALALLRSIAGERNTVTVSYEIRPVKRHTLFLLLALICFVISIAISECDIENYRKRLRRTAAVALVASACLFSSCSNARLEHAKEILTSSWAWHQKNYNSATAGFLRVKEDALHSGDALAVQYAYYNLAATYIMQGEYSVALSCLQELSPDAPQHVQYAACYNRGIVAYRSGDYKMAADCFKSALMIDNSKVEAKENLEIARRWQIAKETRTEDSELLPVVQDDSEVSAIENAIFQHIRENDRRQWKNSEQTEQLTSSVDY
ncbi:MAG: VWA domain-containing protein [Treponema sp.]|nr:VWA domain-containing protein [Treponema sp.]